MIKKIEYGDMTFKEIIILPILNVKTILEKNQGIDHFLFIYFFFQTVKRRENVFEAKRYRGKLKLDTIFRNALAACSCSNPYTTYKQVKIHKIYKRKHKQEK